MGTIPSTNVLGISRQPKLTLIPTPHGEGAQSDFGGAWFAEGGVSTLKRWLPFTKLAAIMRGVCVVTLSSAHLGCPWQCLIGTSIQRRLIGVHPSTTCRIPFRHVRSRTLLLSPCLTTFVSVVARLVSSSVPFELQSRGVSRTPRLLYVHRSDGEGWLRLRGDPPPTVCCRRRQWY